MGITSIGENRVNDAIKKFESSENMPDVEKRFIGHLQSNKTKKCVNAFDTIDSIHSLKLLKKVSKECEKIKKKIEVLLEINTSGETQKKGFSAEAYENEVKLFKEKVNNYSNEKNTIVNSFNDFKKKEIDKIFKKITPIIKSYMDSNSVSILLDTKNIFMGNVKNNVTNEILKEINKSLN